jgi:DNA-binding transcriptional LysR family regulator
MGEHGNIVDKSDDWYTPPAIFDALGCKFDLDVAAPVEGPRHVPASRWFHEGWLEQNWSGFVWMNPPLGHQSTKQAWLKRFIEHGDGIALMPDRTSAPWWQWAAPQMDALLFVTPKIKFERPDGSLGEQPGSGTGLMALGRRAVEALRQARHSGLGVLADPKQGASA